MDRRPTPEGESSAKRRRMDGEGGRTPEVDEEDDLIVTLPEDVKSDITHILANAPLSKASQASFEKTYGTLASPGLRVDGHGLVGLPVSVAEGERLAEALKRTTLPPQDVVKVSNTAWSSWASLDAVPSACRELGVPGAVDGQLQKLLVLTAGAPAQTLEPAGSNRAFAFLVIALPSEGTGGSIEVSMAGATTSHALSDSLVDTRAVAWYHRHAQNTIRPPSEGCQVYLVYELTLVDPAVPMPSPSQWLAAVGETREVLSAWKSAYKAGMGLKRLCHFIDPESNITSATLSGQDAAKWGLLKEAAKLEGFRAFFVRMKVSKNGLADDEGCYEERAENTPYHDYYDPYDSELEEDEVGMCSCAHHDFLRDGGEDGEEPQLQTVWSVVSVESDCKSLDHIRTGGGLRFDEEEMCPRPVFDLDDPDDEIYSPAGEESGDLTYIYHGAVLLIYPEEEHDNLLAATLSPALVVTHLVQAINLLKTDPATARPRVTRYMAALSSADSTWHAKVFETVCSADDLIAFGELVQALLRSTSKNLMVTIGQASLIRAMALFNFPAVRPLFDKVLSSDSTATYSYYAAPSSTRKEKLDFIVRVKARDPYGVDQAWVAASLGAVLAGTTQLAATDIESIVGMMESIGEEAFRTSLLPKLPAVDFAPPPRSYNYYSGLAASTASTWQSLVTALMPKYPALGKELLVKAASTLPLNSSTGTAFVNLARLAHKHGLYDQILQPASNRLLESYSAPGTATIPTPMSSRLSAYVDFVALYKGKTGLDETPPHASILTELRKSLVNATIALIGQVRQTVPSKAYYRVLTDAQSIAKVAIALKSSPLVDQLSKALVPTGTSPSNELMTTVLIPLGQELAAAGPSANRLPAVRNFLSTILSTRLAQLGPIPAQATPDQLVLPRTVCTCADCGPLNTFLASSVQHEHRIRAVQSRRTHVETYLRRRTDVILETVRHGSPHTLLIKKRAYNAGAVAWEQKKAGIIAFVKATAKTAAEVDEIYGAHKAVIASKLGRIY